MQTGLPSTTDTVHFTGACLHLALSYGAPDEGWADLLGPGPLWHLSASEVHRGLRQPSGLPEILGWVMAGWPAATRFIA